MKLNEYLDKVMGDILVALPGKGDIYSPVSIDVYISPSLEGPFVMSSAHIGGSACNRVTFSVNAQAVLERLNPKPEPIVESTPPDELSDSIRKAVDALNALNYRAIHSGLSVRLDEGYRDTDRRWSVKITKTTTL